MPAEASAGELPADLLNALEADPLSERAADVELAAGDVGAAVDHLRQDAGAVVLQEDLCAAREHRVELVACDVEHIEGPFDVVVNATAASMSGAAIPVPASVLKPGTLACDMMYGPAALGFMDWARSHGAVPRDGLGMLVEQAAEAFLFWRGVRPPSAQVLAELRATLP